MLITLWLVDDGDGKENGETVIPTVVFECLKFQIFGWQSFNNGDRQTDRQTDLVKKVVLGTKSAMHARENELWREGNNNHGSNSGKQCFRVLSGWL